MYMKFFSKIFLCLFFVTSTCFYAQNTGYKSGVSNILNAANPEDIGYRTGAQVQEDKDDPLEYGYVNDKDILWSTTVWEIIDLDQRVNYPLLYPVDLSVVGDERRPMLWWLKQEIEKFNIPVYDAENIESDGEFIERLPDERVENIFKRKVTSAEGRRKLSENEEQIEERLTLQFDQYGFNPYEEEISEEQKQILAADSTFKPIFPYTIKKFEGGNFKELTDDIFTYNQYLGYRESPPVRVVQPEGLPEELSEDAIDEYNFVLSELVETEFFVEDVDFFYKNLQYDDLKQWLIKGIWYFDKKYSELIYRPIGIAPVAVSLDEEDDGGGDDEDTVIDPRILDQPDGEDSDGDGISDFDEVDAFDTNPQLADTDGDGLNDGFENNIDTDPTIADPEHKQLFDERVKEFEDSQDKTTVTDDSPKETIVPLFWVYYPHAREILKKGQAFNNRNTSKYISFDDIINSRRFSSVIYKEENVYENREVKDYIKNNSFMRLLESERIKEKIRNFEHDMWSW